MCLTLFGQPFQFLPELSLFLLLFLDCFELQSQPYLPNALPTALDHMKAVAYDYGFWKCGLRYGPMLFDRSIVISATFRRISSDSNISFFITSDGFVPFIMAMMVWFSPCPSLLWRMVYTSWQNDVSSKPKWANTNFLSRKITLKWISLTYLYLTMLNQSLKSYFTSQTKWFSM